MATKIDTQRGETFAGYTTLETKACAVCGVLYAAPQRLFQEHKRDGGTWYCPNGHPLVFCETTEEKLRRERARSGRLAADRDQVRARLQAQRAATTRAKNEKRRIGQRVAAGVCPCCGRTFKQLARHMKAKHPRWKPDA